MVELPCLYFFVSLGPNSKFRTDAPDWSSFGHVPFPRYKGSWEIEDLEFIFVQQGILPK